jgi:multicomponent Na+:H+ antiporter subunit D
MIHPSFVFLAGALIVPFLRSRLARLILLLVIPVGAFLLFLVLPTDSLSKTVFGYNLTPIRLDALSLPFGYIFIIIAFGGIIYALHIKETFQHSVAFFYAGSSLGAVLSGDFITLFIFWELMSLSAVFLIWSNKTAASLNAGLRYLMVHIFGGVCLLAGILIHYHHTASFSFGTIGDSPGRLFILLGFMINAAVVPFHSWLTDAYPEGTITGSVFLSAFTTKTAVYVLARGFDGSELLMWLGAIMAIYGVLFATIENDLRRLLSYHIVSQVGYMVAGVGIGTYLSINGSIAHAFSHILYKALLFMSAGSIIYLTGKRKLSDLQETNNNMSLVMVFYLIGAFSISGIPLFNGFISKSITVYSAGEAHRYPIELLLHLASIGTFYCITLKVPYCLRQTGRPADQQTVPAGTLPFNMILGMSFISLLCIIFGVYPSLLYKILPYQMEFSPYTGVHIINTMQLVLATAFAFWLLRHKLVGQAIINLDTDWFYRKGAVVFLWLIHKVVLALRFKIQDYTGKIVVRVGDLLKSEPLTEKYSRQRGVSFGVLFFLIVLFALSIIKLFTK